MSRPGTRKSASLASMPRSSSRTAPPTTYASRPSDLTYSSMRSDECDRLDLDERPGRQPGDLDRRARRRRVAHVLRVHLVHPREVVQVLQEDRRLHEPLEGRARLLQYLAQVREDLLRLRADVSTEQVVLARSQRQLPGDEDEAAGLDRLRVRRPLERRRRCLGANNLLAHICSSGPGTGLHAWPSAAPTAL